MPKQKIKAFTLVELILVITLVMLLSAISVPIYKNYSEDAALSEGYALLGRLRSAQEAYFAEHGWFLANTSSSMQTWDAYTFYEKVLDINARTNKYFTAFSVCCHVNTPYPEVQCANMQRYKYAPVVIGKVNGSEIKLAFVYNLTTTGTKYYRW
ncbi:MAG: prepilin-type N-terminal cleavage/methylation domain-containing protein [Elusimicrobia bacterium]|nr:prepilin-type N-terminal cleavage/methylation domain-containing protein [Elusimicrobiota bacterium]